MQGLHLLLFLSHLPLCTYPTKWSDTLKQFSQLIAWVCLTILWGWRLKVYGKTKTGGIKNTPPTQIRVKHKKSLDKTKEQQKLPLCLIDLGYWVIRLKYTDQLFLELRKLPTN